MNSDIDTSRPAVLNRDSITPSVTRFDADMRADGVPGLTFEAMLAGRWDAFEAGRRWRTRHRRHAGGTRLQAQLQPDGKRLAVAVLHRDPDGLRREVEFERAVATGA